MFVSAKEHVLAIWDSGEQLFRDKSLKTVFCRHGHYSRAVTVRRKEYRNSRMERFLFLSKIFSRTAVADRFTDVTSFDYFIDKQRGSVMCW